MLKRKQRLFRPLGAFFVLGAGILQPPAPAAEAQAPVATIYTHLTLIDGTGAPAASDMAIVVEGELIKAVLPAADLARHPVPGATVVDLTGKFALPGLIDTHQHLGTLPHREAAEAQLRRMLYGGITAVRDMAGDARFLADLARSARLAEIPAPEIYFSALMAGPGFFADPRTHSAAQGAVPGKVPWLQAITAQTDMPTAVALARGTGAAGIKLYADLPAAEVRRIVAEAHRQGFPVWCHAMIFPTTPAEEIAAGVDSVSHAYMLAYALLEKRPGSYRESRGFAIDPVRLRDDTTVLPGLFAEMKRRGVILDATVHTFFESDRHKKPEAPVRGPICARVAAAAYQAGVALSAGTDFTPTPEDTYPALQTEIETLVREVGLTPADAIRAATATAARALKADDQMGTVTAGKLANVVIVARSPLDDISALREVVLTLKRGRAYPRSDYHQPSAEALAKEY
jgi:imidazolonepropionase-like amidohydrolase